MVRPRGISHSEVRERCQETNGDGEKSCINHSNLGFHLGYSKGGNGPTLLKVDICTVCTIRTVCTMRTVCTKSRICPTVCALTRSVC